MMVWVYYSAQIFLFGAEFTWVYANEFGSRRDQNRKEQERQTAESDAPTRSNTDKATQTAHAPRVETPGAVPTRVSDRQHRIIERRRRDGSVTRSADDVESDQTIARDTSSRAAKRSARTVPWDRRATWALAITTGPVALAARFARSSA